MKIRIAILSLLTLSALQTFAQKIVYQDANHVVHYTVVSDTVKVSVEILGDNSIEIDDNGVLEQADDFVQLMFDLNASGGIDFGSQVDLIYQHDTTQTKDLCSSHITGPSTITSCGTAASNGNATVKLGTSVYSATPHVIYDFCIPKQELDYNNTLCVRMSVNIHSGGDPLSSTTKIPNSTDEYFVDPYNAVELYEELDLGPDINACVGDTIWSNAEYPYYFWNTHFDDVNFAIVLNDFDEYGLKISDNTCTISDSVKVNVLTDAYCTGSSYGFPNVLSPNNDGANDIFEPVIGQDLLNQDWTGAELRIYNRWGVQVFKSPENAYPNWDCRDETGDVAASGTYFYIFLPPGENIPAVNGFFMIVNEDR